MRQYLKAPEGLANNTRLNRWPNIYRDPSYPADYELGKYLGLSREELPTQIGAVTLVFGKYEDDVRFVGKGEDRRLVEPVSVRAWALDPATLSPDEPLYSYHRRIQEKLPLQHTEVDGPTIPAWLWPVEYMEGECYPAALTRYPLTQRQRNIVSRAMVPRDSQLAGYTFFTPESLAPDTATFMVTQDGSELVTRRAIAAGAFAWVGEVGDLALQNA